MTFFHTFVLKLAKKGKFQNLIKVKAYNSESLNFYCLNRKRKKQKMPKEYSQRALNFTVMFTVSFSCSRRWRIGCILKILHNKVHNFSFMKDFMPTPATMFCLDSEQESCSLKKLWDSWWFQKKFPKYSLSFLNYKF